MYFINVQLYCVVWNGNNVKCVLNADVFLYYLPQRQIEQVIKVNVKVGSAMSAVSRQNGLSLM